ncbi:MAG: TatD family hydrolase, partial [Candidatus Dormibacteraeota bacterium]|nr:TatD family hydrolase [Candidatus Dormibacteraeota bacterium]
PAVRPGPPKQVAYAATAARAAVLGAASHLAHPDRSVASSREPLSLVDTHLHLEELGQGAEIDAAIADAVAAGVTRLVTMGGDAASSRKALALAQSNPAVFAAAGHHAANHDDPDLPELRRLLSEPRTVAVGEVGLDGSPGADYAPMDRQEAWFGQLCDLAVEHDLPVSVHVREAADQVLRIITARPGLRGVMHYFSLDWDWAQRFLEAGFHLSFAGVLTRPSRGELREVVRRCPADRLLLETDSPYGLPHSRRRERANCPSFLVDTAAVVAELRGISLSALAELEWTNAHEVFSRMPGPA